MSAPREEVMPFRLGMLAMWHTHAHGLVRQVAEHPKEFTLVGFYDPDDKVMADRQKGWPPLVKKMGSFEKPDGVRGEPLDGVVVEGRVFESLRLARLAIDRSKPVLLEKPAGDNFDDFRRLIDAAQRKHLHVQMLYLFRYMPAVQEMLQRGRKGDYGRIYEFRARLPKDFPSYQRFV